MIAYSTERVDQMTVRHMSLDQGDRFCQTS